MKDRRIRKVGTRDSNLCRCRGCVLMLRNIVYGGLAVCGCGRYDVCGPVQECCLAIVSHRVGPEHRPPLLAKVLVVHRCVFTYMNAIITNPLRHKNGSNCHTCRGEEYKQHTSKDDASRQHASVIASSPGGHEGEASAHLQVILAASCSFNRNVGALWFDI